MIEIDGLTKRYGDKTAVDRLSFVVEPGVVTGFLGPNGAGKSTTMRMIAGLDRPTTGTVRVNGKHYPGAAAPMSELGILLDARSVHPGLSARDNLLALARTAGLGRRRVDEVIELAGLAEVAGTRAGGFSLGMGQRLGVAAALLGQPQTVVLDEPVNGLDPDGVRWIRLLLKSLAAEGRTVFVSSHLGCGPAPAASCSKTPRPLTWSPPSIPSPPAAPSSRRPPRPASSTSSPPAQGQKHPAATPPPSYGRPLPAASKTSSPASRRACPTARSRPACSCPKAQ
jgi:ABC-type Na+ transport system ATPase subunit NatA